jgi:hypothetical protein
LIDFSKNAPLCMACRAGRAMTATRFNCSKGVPVIEATAIQKKKKKKKKKEYEM